MYRGENPKDQLQKKLTTRMTAVAAIRGELDKAIVYMECKERGETVHYDAGCEALQSVTVNPAKHLGIRHRVGALEEGLDADIVVTSGSILDIFVRPEAVFVYGERVTL